MPTPCKVLPNQAPGPCLVCLLQFRHFISIKAAQFASADIEACLSGPICLLLQGAISEILPPQPATAGLVITAGADASVVISDARMDFQPVARMKLTDFPYSLTAVAGLVVCGCGDGSLHVADIPSQSLLYALGAQRAAVRAACAFSKQLVCAGDDGSVICYDMTA